MTVFAPLAPAASFAEGISEELRKSILFHDINKNNKGEECILLALFALQKSHDEQ
jgi:hypothetical protein